MTFPEGATDVSPSPRSALVGSLSEGLRVALSTGDLAAAKVAHRANVDEQLLRDAAIADVRGRGAREDVGGAAGSRRERDPTLVAPPQRGRGASLRDAREDVPLGAHRVPKGTRIW